MHGSSAAFLLWYPQSRPPIMQVNFGELFFGESDTRSLVLVNNGATEACFDLSFGSVSDLKALLTDDEPSTPDDRLAAFLQVAKIRVSIGACGCCPARESQQSSASAFARKLATICCACIRFANSTVQGWYREVLPSMS